MNVPVSKKKKIIIIIKKIIIIIIIKKKKKLVYSLTPFSMTAEISNPIN